MGGYREAFRLHVQGTASANPYNPLPPNAWTLEEKGRAAAALPDRETMMGDDDRENGRRLRVNPAHSLPPLPTCAGGSSVGGGGSRNGGGEEKKTCGAGVHHGGNGPVPNQERPFKIFDVGNAKPAMAKGPRPWGRNRSEGVVPRQ